jgi:hypothetical protein
MPTRMTVAQIRMSTIAEIGKSGPCLLDGTSGSRSPIAVVFRGGPPPREEDACVFWYVLPLVKFVRHSKMLLTA